MLPVLVSRHCGHTTREAAAVPKLWSPTPGTLILMSLLGRWVVEGV